MAQENVREQIMSEECVLLDYSDDGVATITLNRPEVHNAFDDAMIARLEGIFDDVAESKSVRAVVLRAKGKSFSAGADINWMKRAAEYNIQQNQIDAMELASMLNKLYTMPKLTVACVFGAAMGGGMGLVSCCDIVIAEKETKFALSEVKLGLIPATIGPYVIRAIGERQARRYFQTGERFDGEVAYRLGLVHELAARPEDVEPILHNILNEIKGNGPQAMTAAKKLCLDLSGKDILPKVLEDTANRIALIRAGDEAREGLDAFINKRDASWKK